MNNKKLSLFLALASIVVFSVNVHPVFEIGFYQDDYKAFLNVVKDKDWNIFRFLVNNPLDAGFRPFVFIDRIIFYNIFGNNFIMHRLYLVCVQALIAFILYQIAKKLTNDNFLSSFSLLFYVSMVYTLQTVFSSVAFCYADLFIILFIYLLIRSLVDKEFKIIWIFLLCLIYILALGNKENAIAILPVAIIILFKYKGDTPANFIISLLISLSIITIIYFVVYYYETAEISKRTITKSEFDLTNLTNIILGTFFSAIAPISNLFRVVRVHYNVGFELSIFYTSLPLILISIAIISNTGAKFIRTYVRQIFSTMLYLMVICFCLLFPYVLNPYFESRMMIISFSLGVLWSAIWIGNLLLWFYKNHEKTRLALIVTSVILMVSIGLHAAVPDNIKLEHKMSNDLITIANSIKVDSYSRIGINGFEGKAGFLRSGNARGLLEYVTSGAIEIVQVPDDSIQLVDYPVIISNEEITVPYSINMKNKK